MYDESTLKDALKNLYGDYLKQMPRWYRQGTKTEEIDNAWKVYSNASSTQTRLLILGDISIRSNEDLLQNFGTTANYPMRAQNTLAASNQKGSVLNEKYWWPLINDAWVLGGANSRTPFYMSYGTQPPDDDLWDSSAGRPRVLGRELWGLFNFGYRRIRHDHEATLGLVFAPVDESKAKNARFVDYLNVLNGASLDKIKDIFKMTAYINWADYTLPSAG
jgi:hypothetical protein